MKRIILKPKEYFWVIIFFIILIALSWVTVNEIETSIKNDVKNSLKTVLNTTEIAFEQWKTRKESEILMFSKEKRVLGIVKRLLKVNRTPKSLLKSKEQKEIRDYFRPLLKQFGYIGIFVIAKDSISLASMRDANVGTKNFIYYKRGELLKEVWNGKTKYIPPISSDVPLKSLNGELVQKYPTMFFAAPIFNEKNKVIAVFTLRIDVLQDFTNIAELGRIGESGETYAVDRNGWLITRSRFAHQLVKTGRISDELLEIGTIKITDPGGNMLDGYTPEVPLNKLPLTVMAKDVTSGNSNFNVKGYRDYRGVTVYGAWYWDNKLGIGITTEIDEEEAMSTFLTIKYAIIILILILLILTSSMLFVLNRTRKRAFDELKKAHDKLEEEVIERKQAEKKIRESQQRLSSHLNNTPLGAIFWDVDFKVISWNKSAEKIFGYSKEEALGKHANELIVPRKIQDKIGKGFNYLLKQTEGKKSTNENITKNGKRILCDWYNVAITDLNGKITGVASLVDNITERKKTEEELKTSNEFNKSLIETIPFGLDIVDLEGNILFMNSLLKDAVGIENPKEKCWKLYKDNGKQCTECPLKDEMKLGETNICEIHNVFGGREYEVTYTVMNYKNQKALLEVFRDITESKKAQKEILKLSRAVEQSPNLVIITDLHGKIEYANPKITEVTGYTQEELIGQNPHIFKSGQMSKETYEELWDTIQQGKVWKGELLNKTKYGELFWESVTIAPIIDNKGKIINYIGIKEDITEKKKMTEELIEAKEKAEEASRLKSNFLANMSHELRTPLVGILGFSEIIKNEAENEEFQEYGAMIYSSTLRLQRTLNSVLDFSKVDGKSFKLEYDKVNVNKLAKEEFNLLKVNAEKKQIDYKLNLKKDTFIIKSNNRLLATIFNHIIDNGIKYTKEGFVEVNVNKAQEADGTFLLFEVRDSGIGIEKEKLHLIWEDFRQVSEGLARTYEGVGLGLSIVKKFVSLLNGSIEVKSEYLKGSSFCVKIPIEQI